MRKKTAIGLIRAERKRQMTKEKWTPGHDDLHNAGELARGAACYATPERFRLRRVPKSRRSLPVIWPWHRSYWKPTPDDRIRELVKAGALIVAEIERLQRANRRPKA